MTKYGRPVAKLVPLDGPPPRPLFGRARHTVVHVAEDAFAPTPELWGAIDDGCRGISPRHECVVLDRDG